MALGTPRSSHSSHPASHRAFVSLLCVSLAGATVALSGCGGGGDNGGNKSATPTPTPTPSSTPIPGATPTPTPSPTATPVPSGYTRKIVFTSGTFTTSDSIFIMNPDGTNRVQITHTEDTEGTDGDEDAALSPDERQVVFVRDSRQGFALMVVNADGTNLRQIDSNSSYLRTPRWHPDGTKIIYGIATSPSTGLFTIRPDGTGKTRLTEAGSASLPDYSPDGTKIAFVSLRAGTGQDIYTMNVDGSNLVRLTNTPDYSEWNPRWSPDGTKIVSYCDAANSVDKRSYVVNVDGSGRIPIGPEDKYTRRPCWSPDGAKILCDIGLGAGMRGSDLYLVNADGSNLQNLTNTEAELESEPSW